MTLITDPYSFDELKLEIDKNGFAHTNAKIMKVGQLTYEMPGGEIVHANISLDDLEKVKASLGPISLTYRHPPDLVSPKDIKKYHVGMTKGKPEIMEMDGEQWLVDGAIIQDENAINIAKEGKIGGSAGYWRDALKVSDGVVDFKNILPNHYAFGCLNPRAKGAELFSLDSSDSEHGRIYELDTQQTSKKEVRMKRTLNAVKGQGYSLDEAPIEYNDESDGAVETMAMRQKALIGQFDTELEKVKTSFDDTKTDLETKVGDLSGENKILKTQKEELEEKAKKSVSMDDLKVLIKEMADIKASCDNRGIEDDFDTPAQGKRLCVENESPGVSFDDNQIDGAYKMLKPIEPKDAAALKKAKKALADSKGTSMDSPDKVSLSQLSMAALRKNKQTQKRKGA